MRFSQLKGLLLRFFTTFAADICKETDYEKNLPVTFSHLGGDSC